MTMKFEEITSKLVSMQLESKEMLLRKLIETPEPDTKNEILRIKFHYRIENAKAFLYELTEIENYLKLITHDVYIVKRNTMNKLVSKADFADLTFDGKYCKMVRISTYPYRDVLLISIQDLSSF